MPVPRMSPIMKKVSIGRLTTRRSSSLESVPFAAPWAPTPSDDSWLIPSTPPVHPLWTTHGDLGLRNPCRQRLGPCRRRRRSYLLADAVDSILRVGPVE